MQSLSRTKKQTREADFYLRAQEASMKVDTAGKAQREKLVDNEMIVWARARVRVE